MIGEERALRPDLRRTRRSLLTGLVGAGLGLSFEGLEGCSRKPRHGANGEEMRLNFYNWDTYIGRTTLKDFHQATGVRVRMSLFATADELFSKLRSGNPGFDVIVPSNDYVQRLSIAGLIQPLDHAKLPNLKNLYPEFIAAPFDPGRKFSAPYTWDVLGIGYRRTAVQGVPDSWKWLFNSSRYKGRIALYSDSSDYIQCFAKYLGFDANHIPQALIERIVGMSLRQKPFIKTFHDDNGQDLLLSGDVDLVMEFNGDIAQVMREDEELDFVVPKEGSILHSDALAIPTGAPRPDNAHQFINFLLSADAGAALSETILYPSPNAAAVARMPAWYRDDPVIFPPRDRLARCQYALFEGLAQTQRFDEAMTRIRAA